MLSLTSPSFRHGEPIPPEHTCRGRDVSPALAWSGVPPGTRSLALVVDDPDAPDPAAPRRTWVHWVLYAIPPDTPGLPQGVARAALPTGTHEGLNDWHRPGWGGPCPPVGRHRYFFHLYALDAALPDLHTPDRARLAEAMAGHVLEEAQLMGTFAQDAAH